MAQALPFIMMAFTAVSTVMQMKAAKKQKQQRAKQEAMALENARQEKLTTAMKMKQSQRLGYLRSGDARAAAAGSGREITGSAMDVLADIETQNQIEQSEIQRLGFASERNMVAQAGMYRDMGKSEYQAGMLGAAGTLVSGASASYTEYKRVG